LATKLIQSYFCPKTKYFAILSYLPSSTSIKYLPHSIPHEEKMRKKIINLMNWPKNCIKYTNNIYWKLRSGTIFLTYTVIRYIKYEIISLYKTKYWTNEFAITKHPNTGKLLKIKIPVFEMETKLSQIMHWMKQGKYIYVYQCRDMSRNLEYQKKTTVTEKLDSLNHLRLYWAHFTKVESDWVRVWCLTPSEQFSAISWWE
jgi:hypothetical protein